MVTSEHPCTASCTIPFRDSSASTITQHVRAIVQTSMGNWDFSTNILDPVRDPPVKTLDLQVPSAEARTPPMIDAEKALHLLN